MVNVQGLFAFAVKTAIAIQILDLLLEFSGRVDLARLDKWKAVVVFYMV